MIRTSKLAGALLERHTPSIKFRHGRGNAANAHAAGTK